MNLGLATLVVVGFAAVIEWLSLPDRALEVGRRSRDSLEVLRDPSLDEDTKERKLQRNALELFRLLGLLVGGSLLALGSPLLVVWLLQLVGIGSLDVVLSILQRIDFLVAATFLGFVVYLAVRRLGRR